MKVTGLRTTLIHVPLAHVYSGSRYQVGTRCTVLVDVETDQGVMGTAYCGDERDALAELGRLVRDLGSLLIGADLFSIEALWHRMFQAARDADDLKLFMHAVSAVDLALWDAQGKALGVPLYRLWGGYRSTVPIIAIGGYYEPGKGLAELVEEMQAYREMGLAGVKLKVGRGSVDDDVARVRAIREALGEQFVIACDANQGWTLAEAVQFAECVRPYGVAWLEEPVHWYDQYRGMREVRRRTGIPVCAGQSEISGFGCRQLVESDSVDILNVDASWAGGPTAWRKIAGMAFHYGVRMGHHEEPHVSMHLLASIPNGTFVECFHPERDPLWYRMVVNRPAVHNGLLSLPESPGLGIEIDPEFVEHYKVG